MNRARDLTDHTLAYLARQLELKLAALRPGSSLFEQYSDKLDKLRAEINRRGDAQKIQAPAKVAT